MRKQRGFTLLEILLVLVVIGVLVGVATPNFSMQDPEDVVAKPAQRFKIIFDMASDYAMLNQYELGIIFKDDNYRFVAFDGTRWVDFQADSVFEPSDHEEGVSLALELDGLPWAEESLLNEKTLQIEEEDNDEDVEILSPQVFVLSSGDISPFRLTFSYDPGNGRPIYYQVSGDFAAPVSIDGPLDRLP